MPRLLTSGDSSHVPKIHPKDLQKHVDDTVDERNPAPPEMYKTLYGINYQPHLVIAGFLNHQQYLSILHAMVPGTFFLLRILCGSWQMLEMSAVLCS